MRFHINVIDVVTPMDCLQFLVTPSKNIAKCKSHDGCTLEKCPKYRIFTSLYDNVDVYYVYCNFNAVVMPPTDFYLHPRKISQV